VSGVCSGAPLCCEGDPLTFVHSVGDLVEFTTVAIVGDDLGRVGFDEAGHCREVEWLAEVGNGT
jgi:hypothetical protein